MNNYSIKDAQIDTLMNIATELINNLKEKEALYIIDHSMNVRVLFYYKPMTYFLSDPFSISNIEYIDLKDGENLINLCNFISTTFEGTNYLLESKLIKNIDKFIENYMINNLVILVNRVEQDKIEPVSLEYYNDLFLVNLNGLFKLTKVNNNIFKQDMTNLLYNIRVKSNDYFLELLNHVYTNDENIYPSKVNSFDLKPLDLSDLDIIFNAPPVFIMSNISSSILLAYEKININTKDSDKLYNAVSNILDIDKNSEYLIEDINEIVEDYSDDKKSVLLN